MARPTLKRSLGLWLMALYGLGNIVGAGIYVLIGKVAGEAGYGTALAFVIASIVAGLTALSYMELSARFPVSAGATAFVHGAFNKSSLSRIIGILMVVSGVVSTGVLARGFAGYTQLIVPLPEPVLIIVVITILTLVAVKGMKESATLATIFTFIELIGLGLIIWFGKSSLVTGLANPAQTFAIDPRFGLAGVLAGAFLAFYAFIGFEDMVNVAEEVKKPERTMPLAIIIALVTATILYIAVAIIATNTINPTELASSEAPMTLVFSRLTTAPAFIITIIGISAAINGGLAHIIMGSRMLYGMAKRGWIREELAKVHADTRTPVVATLVIAITTTIIAIFMPLEMLARATSLIVLCIFVLVNISLYIIKGHPQKRQSTLKVPRWIPLMGAICSACLIVFEIING
ncbi:amino acid permease [bacterium]|nr:MAG: amino acid permease [bacterium]